MDVIERGGAQLLRIKVGGCWFLCRDIEAGVRAYTGERGAYRFWTGFYGHKAIDHFTGLRVAELVGSASEQEYNAYPRLLEKVIRARGGETPRAVCGDKGLSVSKVYKLNTELGIRSVFPWRKRPGLTDRSQVNCERYDQYGVPRCQVCFGPTRFVRFRFTSDRPRLWYQCERPTPDCPHDARTISCGENWTMLLPLWRTSETYLALRIGHMEYERVHNLQRVRNNDCGDHHITRPRKVGAAWQQLRASASILIDWLLAAERNGWFGTPSRNSRQVVIRRAEPNVRRLDRMREERGLHLTGERYPGHGRRRPLYIRRSGSADPPDNPAASAARSTDDIPF